MREYTSLRLEITSNCNLNCEYCHNKEYNNRPQEDMTFDQIKKLIYNLKKKYSINKILLTGGEPLTNKNVLDIVRFISKLGIKTDMATNGVLLTNNLAKELDTAGLKRIRISIDEDSEPYELWEKAKMVSMMTKNIEVCIHTVCTPKNINGLYKVYQKVLKCGAKRWRVFDLGFQGGVINGNYKFDLSKYYEDYIMNSKTILEDYVSSHQDKQLDIEINNIFRTTYLKMEYDPKKQPNVEELLIKRSKTSPCDYVTNHQLTIRSDGKATLCQYYHNPIYDYTAHLFDIEESINHENVCLENIITINNILPCVGCKYLLLCNSGCRAKAQFLTGSIFDADPIACYLQPMIEKQILPVLTENYKSIFNSYIYSNGHNPKYQKNDLQRLLKDKGL